MSEIQVGQINSTDGSTAITTGADGYVSFAKTQMGGRRNLIINGAMQVAQRGTSETGITDSGYFTCDRFITELVSLGTWTHEQSTDAPDGFGNSYKVTCTTAKASPDSGNYFGLSQRIEGQNLQQLKKGTSDALSVTLSFWVKSNKTGTYIAEFDDEDNARNINLSYTVNSADVWEYKTITFVGDTTGVLDNDANNSARIIWWLGAGSAFTSGALATSWQGTVNANRIVGNVNLADTTNNYWQITGVQLEVGTVATPFEHRSYGEELALCQRYYQKSYNADVVPGTSGNYAGSVHFYGGATSNVFHFTGSTRFPVIMRATPTVTYYDPSNGNAGNIRNDSDTSSLPVIASGVGASGGGYPRLVSGSINGKQCSYQYVADAEL